MFASVPDTDKVRMWGGGEEGWEGAACSRIKRLIFPTPPPARQMDGLRRSQYACVGIWIYVILWFFIQARRG